MNRQVRQARQDIARRSFCVTVRRIQRRFSPRLRSCSVLCRIAISRRDACPTNTNVVRLWCGRLARTDFGITAVSRAECRSWSRITVARGVLRLGPLRGLAQDDISEEVACHLTTFGWQPGLTRASRQSDAVVRIARTDLVRIARFRGFSLGPRRASRINYDHERRRSMPPIEDHRSGGVRLRHSGNSRVVDSAPDGLAQDDSNEEVRPGRPHHNITPGPGVFRRNRVPSCTRGRARWTGRRGSTAMRS